MDIEFNEALLNFHSTDPDVLSKTVSKLKSLADIGKHVEANYYIGLCYF